MAFVIYDLFFGDLFGQLQSMKQGGRGFDEIWFSLLGFKAYVTPSRGTKEYFHFEIPGQACELIPNALLQGLDDVLRHNFPKRYHYTRLDLAFDEVPFTPQEVEAAIKDDLVTCVAKRRTLEVQQSPFDAKPNGDIGTYTVYLGSRQSERMIRVYDKRGFTRLELELKGKRADLVAKEVFGAADLDTWYAITLSHLLDYVRFETAWWHEFTGRAGRAWATVTTPGKVTEEKAAGWLRHQVAPMLSVLHDLYPEHFVRDLITQGRVKRRRSKKYDLLLSDGQRRRNRGVENDNG